MATIRFRDLVKNYGRPEAKSLWTDPEHDAAFQRAIQQHRILTIVQEPGRRDFGQIGFHQQPHASYFVFPKALPSGDSDKVVGIKYDLIEEPPVKDALSAQALNKSAPPKPPKSAQNQKHVPLEKTFDVVVRRTAVIETAVTATARTKTEAKKKALAIAKTQPFDLSKAIFRTESK